MTTSRHTRKSADQLPSAPPGEPQQPASLRQRLAARLGWPWPAPTLLALAIVVAGTTLRFYTLDLVRHGFDESDPMYQALRMLDGGQLALAGQSSSVFLDNPVLMSYIQAIPLLIWRSLWGPYLLITALNSLAIGFVYRAARLSFNTTVGLLAAFLYAVSPWVIFFSRPTWVQALIPLFTSIIAWGLFPSLQNDAPRPRAVLIGLLAVTAAAQTYIQAWALAAQAGIILALFWRRYPRQILWIGIAIFGIGALIYASGIPARWADYQARFAQLSASGQPAFTMAGLNHAMRMVSGFDSDAIRIWYDMNPADPRHIATQLAAVLLATALLAGVIRSIVALVRRTEWRIAGALLVWFSLPILPTLYVSVPVHPHYLLISLPAGHLLAAWGMEWGWSRGGRLARAALAVALAAVGVIFGANVHFTGQYVATQTMSPDFNGWPVANDAQLGSSIRALLHASSYPRRVAASGNSENLSSISATYVQTYPEVDYPGWVILPGHDPMLYVLANRSPQPGVLGPHQQDYPGQMYSPARGVAIYFQRVQPYTRDEALSLPATRLDLPTVAGVALLGYSVEGGGSGETVMITTYWRVDALAEGRDQWYAAVFYHLDAEGHPQVVNLTGHGQYGARWVEGDIYVERMPITIPAGLKPGSYMLHLGLFDPIHGQNFPFATAQGNQNAVAVSIPAK